MVRFVAHYRPERHDRGAPLPGIRRGVPSGNLLGCSGPAAADQRTQHPRTEPVARRPVEDSAFGEQFLGHRQESMRLHPLHQMLLQAQNPGKLVLGQVLLDQRLGNAEPVFERQPIEFVLALPLGNDPLDHRRFDATVGDRVLQVVVEPGLRARVGDRVQSLLQVRDDRCSASRRLAHVIAAPVAIRKCFVSVPFRSARRKSTQPAQWGTRIRSTTREPLGFLWDKAKYRVPRPFRTPDQNQRN